MFETHNQKLCITYGIMYKGSSTKLQQVFHCGSKKFSLIAVGSTHQEIVTSTSAYLILEMQNKQRSSTKCLSHRSKTISTTSQGQSLTTVADLPTELAYVTSPW